MSYYLESKRIPPERLVFKDPAQYDRILNTYDIQGAKPEKKQINYDNHGNSLKVNDIPGAQSKRTIRDYKFTKGGLQQQSQNQFAPVSQQQNQNYLQNYYSQPQQIQIPPQQQVQQIQAIEQQQQPQVQHQIPPSNNANNFYQIPPSQSNQQQPYYQPQQPQQYQQQQPYGRQSPQPQREISRGNVKSQRQVNQNQDYQLQQQQIQQQIQNPSRGNQQQQVQQQQSGQVENVSKEYQGNSKVWQNHDYDILGNYVKDKRVYDRAQFSNDLERKNLDLVPNQRISASYNSLPTTTKNFIPKEFQGLEQQDVQALVAKHEKQGFGRSNLFVDHFGARNQNIAPRNITHQENFDVASKQYQDKYQQFKLKTTSIPQLYNPQIEQYPDSQTVMQAHTNQSNTQFGRSDLFNQHHPQGKINLYAQRNITHDSLKEALISHEQKNTQSKQNFIQQAQINQSNNLPTGNEPTMNQLLQNESKAQPQVFGKSGLFSDHIQGRNNYYSDRNYTHQQQCLPGNQIPDKEQIHKIN